MEQGDRRNFLTRIFSPERPRLEKLLFFWGICILLPVAAIFCLLNYSQNNAREAYKAKTIDVMLSAADDLQQICQPENYFYSQIKQTEQMAGLPPENSALIFDRKSSSMLPDALNQAFRQLNNLEMVLLLTADQDCNNLHVFDNPQRFPDYPKPGKRAATMIMREYMTVGSRVAKGKENNASSERLLKKIIESVFGIYLDPLLPDRNLIFGFSEKFGGSRMFIARNTVVAADGKPIFAYIAMFRESGNSLLQGLSVAQKKLAASGLSCRLIMRKAVPFPFVFASPDGSLRLFVPVTFGHLQTGIFDNKDLTSSLIDKGIMHRKPAVYPHFEICAPAWLLQQHVSAGYHGFMLFVLLCLSLLVLKHFHQFGMLKISIRGRLFFSVFLATALPVAIFIFYSHRYIEMRFELRKTDLAQKMKSHLKLLELAIKSKDEMTSAAVFSQLYRVRTIAGTADAEQLTRLFKEILDHTFFGVALLRNDGLFFELMGFHQENVVKLPGKLAFARELGYATAIKLFQHLELVNEKFTSQLQANSRGKKLLALANIFHSTDIDNFCRTEGLAQTSKRDFGHLRLINYKILPAKHEKHSNAAVFLLVQNIKVLVGQILDNFSRNWSFFRPEDNEGTVNITLVECLDMDGKFIDLSKTWPPATTLNTQELLLAKTVSRGKSELEIIDESSHIPVVYAGRKIAGYPVIALAGCSMNELAEQQSFWAVVIGVIFLYIILVLLVLSHMLNDLFVPTINGLLTAAKVTSEGREVVIENDFDNELAHLTGEFNVMSHQIRERERLERFISREAAMAIASESVSMQEMRPQKVKRSILFVHIKQFTQLDAQLTPDKLMNLLNMWFPFVESFVEEQKGQVDKYISDAVMAVFSDCQKETVFIDSAVAAC